GADDRSAHPSHLRRRIRLRHLTICDDRRRSAQLCRTRPSLDVVTVSERPPRLTTIVGFAAPQPKPLGANVTDSRVASRRTPRRCATSRSKSVSPPPTTRTRPVRGSATNEMYSPRRGGAARAGGGRG